MGTRFCVTKEAPIHDSIKQALVNASERDTRLILRSLHNTARVFRNAVSDAVVEAESRGCTFDDIRPLVSGARGAAALAQGEVDGGVITAGQVIGLIRDVPSCAELIARMVDECRAALKSAADKAS